MSGLPLHSYGEARPGRDLSELTGLVGQLPLALAAITRHYFFPSLRGLLKILCRYKLIAADRMQSKSHYPHTRRLNRDLGRLTELEGIFV